MAILGLGWSHLFASEPEISISLAPAEAGALKGSPNALKITIENHSPNKMYVFFNPDLLSGVSLETSSNTVRTLDKLPPSGDYIAPAQAIEPNKSFVTYFDLADYFQILSSGKATFRYAVSLGYGEPAHLKSGVKQVDAKGSFELWVVRTRSRAALSRWRPTIETLVLLATVAFVACSSFRLAQNPGLA